VGQIGLLDFSKQNRTQMTHPSQDHTLLNQIVNKRSAPYTPARQAGAGVWARLEARSVTREGAATGCRGGRRSLARRAAFPRRAAGFAVL